MIIVDVIFALLLGCIAGCISGLIPGIHVNLISLLVVSVSGHFLGLPPLAIGAFIIALAVTHTFLDSIPAVFLGAPDPDMALGVLPGHKLLLEGRGYEAVKLTVIGSMLGLVAVIILMVLMVPIIPVVYSFVQPYIGHLLLVAALYMLFKDWDFKKIVWGSLVFLLSGFLGITVLSWSNLDQPLFPLLSGLFGISTLVVSLMHKTKVPKQRITESINVTKSAKAKAIGASVFCGSLTSLLPGLGSAQAAIIAMQIVGNIGAAGFMILIGGINTVNFAFSLVTFYSLQKARNGAVVAMMEILESITITELALYICVLAVSAGIACILCIHLAKGFANVIAKVNYRGLCIGVIVLIVSMVIYFSGSIGLLILITSSALGIIPQLANVRRSSAMGCLMVPVILFFLL